MAIIPAPERQKQELRCQSGLQETCFRSKARKNGSHVYTMGECRDRKNHPSMRITLVTQEQASLSYNIKINRSLE